MRRRPVRGGKRRVAALGSLSSALGGTASWIFVSSVARSGRTGVHRRRFRSDRRGNAARVGPWIGRKFTFSEASDPNFDERQPILSNVRFRQRAGGGVVHGLNCPGS